eukprot:TRINITY_DN11754_c0_g1_i2.p1 TRINITY_DN11754_c0_g1~~TRINITY_DN11754_c0_g1_i2.p1  ORF type:complete len:301 (-),score=20.68 TRINITY_DN11754_c0_g1_i2:87-989(-)
MAAAACAALGYSRFKAGSWHHSPGCFAVTSGPWDHSPGCFAVTSGRWTGGCHWSSATGVATLPSTNRQLCVNSAVVSTSTSATQTTSPPTPAAGSYILSPNTDICYTNSLQDVAQADCAAACAALGYSRFKAGSWHHSPGCFAVTSGPWAGGCHWSSATGVATLPSTNRQLCVNSAVASPPTPFPSPPTYPPTPPPPPCPNGAPAACCRMCSQASAGNCRRTNSVRGGCENSWVPKGGFYSHCVIARNGKCHANFRGWDHCPYEAINITAGANALSNWGNPSIEPWCLANGLPFARDQWR